MRLISYATDQGWVPGVVRGTTVYGLNELLGAADHSQTPSYGSVKEFLAGIGDSLADVSARVAALDEQSVGSVGELSGLEIGPPVTDPAKVLCVGLNYADHVGETGRKFPDHPDIFAKFDTSLVGPSDAIECTAVTANLDFEGEVAVVIGRRCRNVAEGDALSYVAGLSVLNDITARDLQWRGTQWLPGKAVDGSTPWGPALVTLDEVGDVQQLDIQTRVNGTIVQSSNTRNMIFPIAKVISYVSQFLELAPGDVIATGTPEGIGAKRNPPQWLAAGDLVEVEVQKIGTISNTVK